MKISRPYTYSQGGVSISFTPPWLRTDYNPLTLICEAKSRLKTHIEGSDALLCVIHLKELEAHYTSSRPADKRALHQIRAAVPVALW